MANRSLLDSLKAFFSGEAASATPEPGGPPPQDIWADPEPEEDWRSRLPTSAHDRVILIRDTIHQLEKECAERKMQTELDELGRIKSTHLPSLLQSYIEIPAEHRADVFRETGKSASFLLSESLDKMLARLRDISSQLARGNITTFAENVRFVDLYYEQNKGPFD
jgi:hypothetical protein